MRSIVSVDEHHSQGNRKQRVGARKRKVKYPFWNF